MGLISPPDLLEFNIDTAAKVSRLRQGLNVKTFEARQPAGAATLLLAHGFGCDQRIWHEVVQALPETRRIVFDWPGVGGADVDAYDPVRHASLQGYADDLLALLEEMNLHEVVLVAHSVAASIGVLAARRDPSRLRLLAMVAPTPCLLNDPPAYFGGFERVQLDSLIQGLADGHAAWARVVAPMIMGHADRPQLAEQLADSFCAMDPTIALRWARAAFRADIRQEIADVQVPCLVMQCRDDALAPLAVGRWLQQHLPRSQLAWLQASGHCPHVSAPAEVAAVLAQALA